jgi:hypothetical protein
MSTSSIDQRETVFDRLFLAYRRMYEYGSRLTLRQITEHLAYLVTSGLDETDIADMRREGLKPLKASSCSLIVSLGTTGQPTTPVLYVCARCRRSGATDSARGRVRLGSGSCG